MKYFLIICFLAIFFYCTKGNSDELSSSKYDNQTSFETLKTMLQYIDERLSKLEEKFKEEKQMQDTDLDNVSMKSDVSKINKRLAKIEQTISSLEIKDIEKKLTSFENTLDILMKRLSDTSKKIEESEVSAAVQEKMFRKILADLDEKETLKKERKSGLFINDDTKTVKTMENKKLAVIKKPEELTLPEAEDSQFQKVKKKSDSIVKVEEAGELTELEKPTESEELNKTEGLKGLRSQGESGRLKGLRDAYKTAEAVKLKKVKESIKIGNDFSLSNVTFEKFGTSSIVQGKIENESRYDITTVSFVMKLFGREGNMIAEFDFNIMNIKSNESKLFKEMISGVLPSEISRYEIKYKKSK